MSTDTTSDPRLVQSGQERSLRERIADNPRPAARWGAVLAVLLALEFGAFAVMLVEIVEIGAAVVAAALDAINPTLLNGIGGAIKAGLAGAQEFVRGIPTLLSRGVIPNQGHQTMQNGNLVWVGTFPTNFGAATGFEPKHAWLLRFLLIHAYVFALCYWVYKGYRVFREHYRVADWTPRDDVADRFSRHRWGQFGLVIVMLFLTMALFAPAVSPTTYERNVINACGVDHTYWNAENGQVETMPLCNANYASTSDGVAESNVGLWQYDDFGRFHPFGTGASIGADLYTFLAFGARISLFIGLTAVGLSSLLAGTFGLITAYYKGLADLALVVTSDSIQAIPGFLLLLLTVKVFSGHWLSQIYSGGLLIALVFGFIYWPGLWRAVRGPAFQVSEQEWVDAAKSFGQTPLKTMRKHMLPYILGYLLIYGSLTIGGVIITTSALSFLGNGLGVQPPTPEWGRLVSDGRGYVSGPSWHVATIPGVLIVFVVTAFNALGDGIRDALDPQSDGGDSGTETAAAGGGG